MIQLIIIALCTLFINQFDVPTPDNQKQPEMFVIWLATRVFIVGLITSCITGIFDARHRTSEGVNLKVPWYTRPLKFTAYSAAVVGCSFIAHFVNVEWFSHWWGCILYTLPYAALIAALMAGKTVLDSTDELRGCL